MSTPGVTHNPNGRPPSVKAALRRALAEAGPDGRRRLDEWADSIVAAKTDPQDRLEILASLGELPAPREDRP